MSHQESFLNPDFERAFKKAFAHEESHATDILRGVLLRLDIHSAADLEGTPAWRLHLAKGLGPKSRAALNKLRSHLNANPH